MAQYIETRPEAIEAIKKSITEKWNPICMGCATWGDNSRCILCEFSAKNDCSDCPLYLNDDQCLEDGKYDSYSTWIAAANDGINSAPEEAEAMLEALVQLLPESERTIYGG